MNNDQLLQFLEEFFKNCTETARRKNNDYSGKTDPFGNFRAVEILGISAEDGFLTRMMDKMKRISTLIHSQDVQVKSESIEDTLLDLANYSALLAAYLKSKERWE